MLPCVFLEQIRFHINQCIYINRISKRILQNTLPLKLFLIKFQKLPILFRQLVFYIQLLCFFLQTIQPGLMLLPNRSDTAFLILP